MNKKIDFKGPFVKTVTFIILVCVIALFGLYYSGALDDDMTSMKYNAESICFISGYYDGVVNFTEVSDGVFSFECDRSVKTLVTFDGYKGVIRHSGN